MVAGNLVFTVGVIGNDPVTSALVTGGIQAEFDQALHNLGAILRASGSRFEQLIKATVFLADISDEQFVLDRLAERLVSPMAITVVAVEGMPLGAAVEIECIAATFDTYERGPCWEELHRLNLDGTIEGAGATAKGEVLWQYRVSAEVDGRPVHIMGQGLTHEEAPAMRSTSSAEAGTPSLRRA